MPIRTRHPVFRNDDTRKDPDDELIDAGVGRSISNAVDRLMGIVEKDSEEEG